MAARSEYGGMQIRRGVGTQGVRSISRSVVLVGETNQDMNKILPISDFVKKGANRLPNWVIGANG